MQILLHSLIDCVTSLGLILNELLINSLKCTFNDKDGEIFLKLERNFLNKYQFIYKDKGIGIDVETTNFSSLGIKLVKMLVEEMDASLQIINKKGLIYMIKF